MVRAKAVVMRSREGVVGLKAREITGDSMRVGMER